MTRDYSLFPMVKFTATRFDKLSDNLSQTYQDKKELGISLLSLGSTRIVGEALASVVGAETGSMVFGSTFGTPLLGYSLGAAFGSTIAVKCGTIAQTLLRGRDHSSASTQNQNQNNHYAPSLLSLRPRLVRAISSGVGAETGSRIGNRLLGGSSSHGYRMGAALGGRLGMNVGAALGEYELGSILGPTIRIIVTVGAACLL
eukprot:CAMPEP_0170990482 /NCGR_PEP_ID=MMETSP0736-20130129/8553_1 /TAXON_ID=186038 /ORGANISM="Fragilariopsis kerguelensis, Strain L26-C5" /LENGTH=200 /DNA_ID=CAMNT_0011415515 /DNA_START=267 /DNA_END=869 /DNA_ORIENTATION=+